jgi:hypothetical protein
VGLALTAAAEWSAGDFVLLAGALVPIVYSLIFYKQLERRGMLRDARMSERPVRYSDGRFRSIWD